MLIPINISDNFDSLSWRASFKKFLVTVNYTSTSGSRTIHYFSSKKSRYRKGIYYKALGKPLKNQWMSVERNFNEDLKHIQRTSC